MTEPEAQEWIRRTFGITAVERLARFDHLVRTASLQQNLVSRATLESLWARHIVDSAQLILLHEGVTGAWLDIGTGGGFPGLVVALLVERPVVLCEPRGRRAAFLREAIETLDARNAEVAQLKVHLLTGVTASTISARAVASVKDLIDGAKHCATADTTWLLPRGQSVDDALRDVPVSASFHVEQSITDRDGKILVMRGVH